MDVVCTDYAKAFNKIDHQRLLQKSEGYGISGHTLKWTCNFPHNQRQKIVSIEKSQNGWKFCRAFPREVL